MTEKKVTIKELRVKNGNLTQAEFGKTVGVSPQTVSSWEKNIYSIKPIHLMRICEIYKINSQELLGV